MFPGLEPRNGTEPSGRCSQTNYIIYHKYLSNSQEFILGLLCGDWSDRYGSKSPMVLPLINIYLIKIRTPEKHLNILCT